MELIYGSRWATHWQIQHCRLHTTLITYPSSKHLQCSVSKEFGKTLLNISFSKCGFYCKGATLPVQLGVCESNEANVLVKTFCYTEDFSCKSSAYRENVVDQQSQVSTSVTEPCFDGFVIFVYFSENIAWLRPKFYIYPST